MSDTTSRFPPGWDEERVRAVLEHYESQTEEEAVAEDEAHTGMLIPNDLVPAVRELLSGSSERDPATARGQ